MVFRRKIRSPKTGGDIGKHKFCPICGLKLEGYDTYCTRCGYSFSERAKRKKSKKVKWLNIIVLVVLLIVIYIAYTTVTKKPIIPGFITDLIPGFSSGT